MASACLWNYSSHMNNKKHFFKPGKTGIVCRAALLATLAGCVGHVYGQSVRIDLTPPVVVVAPPVVVATVAVPDDYVYYPGYNVYYNRSRHQYAYLDGGAWVSRPAPMGVSVDVLLASPSVQMDFHDSPANHNAAMVRQYPKNWSSPGAKHDQKENRPADKRDEHGERSEHGDK
jgi:hypothetical protein